MNHFAIRSLAVYNFHLFPMKKSTGKTVVDLFPDYKQLLQNVCGLQLKNSFFFVRKVNHSETIALNKLCWI
jgi:hypothetical protein